MDIINVYKPNVLVIDSDMTYISVLEDLLIEHMNLTFVGSFTEAMKSFNQADFSMVISEAVLPDINVIDMIKKIKLINPNIYLVIITSKKDTRMAVEVMKNGAIDYLIKPFSIEDIANLVEKYLKFSVNKKFDYDLLNVIVEEKRTFKLPTNIHIASPFIYELMEMIKRFKEISKNDLFSIRLALYEILINAIEHGNLEIDYEKKKHLLSTGINYINYLDQLSGIDPFKNRLIEISYHFEKNSISFHIKDEGKGFDVKNFENRDVKSELLALHGRGIIISKFNMDELIYNEIGNEVFLRKTLTGQN